MILVHMVISLAVLSVCMWVLLYARIRASEARVLVLQKSVDAMADRYARLLALSMTPARSSISSGANKVATGHDYDEHDV